MDRPHVCPRLWCWWRRCLAAVWLAAAAAVAAAGAAVPAGWLAWGVVWVDEMRRKQQEWALGQQQPLLLRQAPRDAVGLGMHA